VERIHLAQDRGQYRAVVNTVMDLRVPLNAINFLTRCATNSTLTSCVLQLAITYYVNIIIKTQLSSDVPRHIYTDFSYATHVSQTLGIRHFKYL